MISTTKVVYKIGNKEIFKGEFILCRFFLIIDKKHP